MNPYEAKLAARKARQADRADRLAAEARSLYNQARSMADVIPFGQPILVGHHSERRDRNYRERIHNKFGKAFAIQKAADEAAARAATTSNAISSDDPDAPDKLRERIAKLEADQAKMIAANKLVRKKDRAGLVAMFSEKIADELLQPDFAGRLGFAGYMLTNNSANIRRLKDRLAALERQAMAEPKPDIEGDGWRITEDREDNRLLVIFDAIPPREVRERLKSFGFKWSPSRSAWVRMLNDRARWLAEECLKIGG
jgi:hypothetical protein